MIAERSGTYYGHKMTRGDIYTVAGGGSHGLGNGGPATKAELSLYGVLAVDGSGNLLIADEGHYRVRVVAARSGTFYGRPMTRGDIYSIAGNGQPAFSGDGGPATKAGISGPFSVTLDGSGNVVIPDGNRVRVIAEQPGTFYGQPMSRSDIYTIAGNGLGYSGDGRPAPTAQISSVFGMTVDSHGGAPPPPATLVGSVALADRLT